MIKLTQFNAVEEASTGEGNRLPAGGYVCKIMGVSNIAEKSYLEINYDICEGEFAHYFTDLETRYGFWGLTSRRSYKESAIPFFKRMCSAINNSNTGFNFNPFVDGGNGDETSLIGKYIGLVLREEEYEKNNGEVGTRLVVAFECSVDKIRKGDFKVPAKKCLENKTNTSADSFMTLPTTPEQIPF